MDWTIVDFVFNLIVSSSLIGILIIIWAIIIGMIMLFFIEVAYKCTEEEAKKYPQFRWVSLEEL